MLRTSPESPESVSAAIGINALGGALNVTMKTGRDAADGSASAQVGSYGRAFGSLAYDASSGPWSAYVAVGGAREDGWRRQSPSSVARAYADIGWSGERTELHLAAASGGTSLGSSDQPRWICWPRTVARSPTPHKLPATAQTYWR